MLSVNNRGAASSGGTPSGKDVTLAVRKSSPDFYVSIPIFVAVYQGYTQLDIQPEEG